MKTYKEFIIELNKAEAMMKAGKLALSTVKRIYPKITSARKGSKFANIKIPLSQSDLINQRNTTFSKMLSPRRRIENEFIGLDDVDKRLRTAYRQSSLRGYVGSKAASQKLERLAPMIMRTNKLRRAKGLKDAPINRGFGDSNRELDIPQYKNFKKDYPDLYPTNKLGKLTTKSVNYNKVPDSMMNKLRDAIRQRRKKKN